MSDAIAIYVAVVVFGGLVYMCLGLVLFVIEPIIELLRGDSRRF